jgi:hypothetical protein
MKDVRQTKLGIISDIFHEQSKIGVKPNGKDFDRLYDLPMSEIYLTLVKTTDEVYHKTN